MDRKRGFLDVVDHEDDNSPQTEAIKRTCLHQQCQCLPNGSEADSAIVATTLSAAQLKDIFRSVLHEEFERRFGSGFDPCRLSSSSSVKEAVSGSEKLQQQQLKLIFLLDQTNSIVYTNSIIQLRVAIVNAADGNSVVRTGVVSSAQIEIVVLDGEFLSGRQQEETDDWTVKEFNDSILSQRYGKRPLTICNNLKPYLKDGVAFVNNLSFTDNSNWTKSRNFRLGARIIVKKASSEFPRIKEAISQPFRVKDCRGKMNEKHHPPRGDDEVWRLEGIHKNGAYYNRLSFQGIVTVASFLKTYNEKGPLHLRKLLGTKVSNKNWKAMVDNALECVSVGNNLAPIFEVSSSLSHSLISPGVEREIFIEKQNLVGNETVGGEVFQGNWTVNDEQKNLGDGNELPEIFLGQNQDLYQGMISSMFDGDNLSSLAPAEASTSYILHTQSSGEEYI